MTKMDEVEICIPELEKIRLPDWLTIINYTPLQELEIADLVNKHIWVTAQRKQIPIQKMSTQHIQRCIKCWNGEGRMNIPEHYLGGKKKWLKVFQDELERRN